MAFVLDEEQKTDEPIKSRGGFVLDPEPPGFFERTLTAAKELPGRLIRDITTEAPKEEVPWMRSVTPPQPQPETPQFLPSHRPTGEFATGPQVVAPQKEQGPLTKAGRTITPMPKITPAIELRVPTEQELTEMAPQRKEPGIYALPQETTGEKVGRYIAETTVPFYRQIKGEAEWLSPETMMEVPQWIASMEFIGTVGKGIFNAVKGSTWFRMLTNKERNVVLLSAQDMVKQGMSEGQILRNLNNPTFRGEYLKVREEALGRRITPERPFTEEVAPTPAPKVEKPAKPAEKVKPKPKEVPVEEAKAEVEKPVEALPPSEAPAKEVLQPVSERVKEPPIEPLPAEEKPEIPPTEQRAEAEKKPEWFKPPEVKAEKPPMGFPEITTGEDYWEKTPSELREEGEAVSTHRDTAIKERKELIKRYQEQKPPGYGRFVKKYQDEIKEIDKYPIDRLATEQTKFEDLAWEEAKNQGYPEEAEDEFRYAVQESLTEAGDEPISKVVQQIISMEVPDAVTKGKEPARDIGEYPGIGEGRIPGRPRPGGSDRLQQGEEVKEEEVVPTFKLGDYIKPTEESGLSPKNAGKVHHIRRDENGVEWIKTENTGNMHFRASDWEIVESAKEPEVEWKTAKLTPTRAGTVVEPEGGEPHLAGEKAEEKPTAANRWQKNVQGKIELYFDKPTFGGLDVNLRDRIKRYFNWSPARKAWVSKGSRNLYEPNSIIEALEDKGIFAKPGAKEEPKKVEKPFEITPSEADKAYFDLGVKHAQIGQPYRPPIVGEEAYKQGYESIKKPLDIAEKESIIEKEVEEGARPEPKPVEGVRPETLEGTPTETLPRPPTVRGPRRLPEPSGAEYLGRIPEGEKPTPEERVQAEPGARGGVGVGEAGVAPETERGPTRPGEREPGAEPVRQPPAKREPTPQYSNFRITPEVEKTLQVASSNVKTRIKSNIEAIKLLKKIEEENRLATLEEQAALSKFTGWGGAPQAFNYWQEEWKGQYKELEDLLSDDEFQAARASTPNAHYTSPDVIRFMWDALDRMGLKKGRILDPSMGTGLFEGLIPEKLLSSTKISGVELDAISGRIAKQLYQAADVRIMGFENTKFPNDFFDIAISNIPFGDYKVHDPAYNKFNASIHDYFFLKSLDKVRPGGIVSFITSHYNMDSINSRIRELISQKADFVGSVRLPNTAFKGIANTEVVTDVIFLKKKFPGQEAAGEDWLQSVEKEGFNRNVYYDSHPENILGKEATTGSMYRQKEYTVEPKPGQELSKDLKGVLTKLPENIIKPFDRPEPKVELTSSIPAPDYVKEGALVISEGKIYQKKGETLNPADIPQAQVGKTKALIRMRDAARELLHKEMESGEESDIKPLMVALNKEYDKFSRQYGPFHAPQNRRDLAFSEDPDYPLILSLENYDADEKRATKSDIFNKRVISPFKKIEKVDTAKESLVVSLSETGNINWGRMQELTGMSQDKLQQDLAGLVFRNPEGEAWQTADEYLSGNVRAKLKVAESAAAVDKSYRANADALKAVQPEDLTYDQIEARLGSPWLLPAHIQDFMTELLEVNRDAFRVGYSPSIATWTMERGRGYWSTSSVPNTETYGTSDISGHELVLKSLNHGTPTIRRTDDDGKTWIDVPATEAAREKQYQLKEKFKEWVWENPERRKVLTQKYNEEMNNLRVRTYEGQHLTLPGIVSEDIIELHPHQKDGVWRILQSPSTLLGHVVGAGKTYTMVAAAMELRRTGIAKKPMFVVPNHLVEQWGEDFLRLYPGAKILSATKKDFMPLNRNVFLSRIATGDWDAVIVPHTSFGKIPMSKEAVISFLNQQKADLEASIMEMEAAGENKRSRIIKQIEKAKKRLEQKILEKLAEEKKTGVLTFEETGADHLFVDEAHYFKNLMFATKMTRVAGVSGSASERASDLYIKTNYLMNKYGRGVVFATGTPVSNTMAEMFTMQRYLQPKALSEHGLQMFDAWAGNFGDTVSSLELAPEGSGYRVKSRFARFVNVPELLQMYRTVADIKTQDMLKLPVPDIQDRKPKIIASPASQVLKDFVQTLVKRAEAVRGGHVDPREDNMLKITNDGRKAALDMRLVETGTGIDISKEAEETKINKAARNIADIYNKNKEAKLTQMVFSDLGTPKSDDRFDVYRDMRDKLVTLGIPRAEIAFIHDYEKEIDKQKLFDRVNRGQVRVLMGSTDKMGVGTNVQKKLIALHHIDAPWRPADIEQREGRIIRQGNDNKVVQIYRYVTEGSFDAYMWQILENKARFITQVMTNRLDARSAEDVEGAALTYAEVKAIASGNPLVIEKVKVDTELRRLQMLRSQFAKNKSKMQDKLAFWDSSIDKAQQRIEVVNRDIATRNIPEEFEIEIGGKIFTERKEAGQAIIDKVSKEFSDVVNKGKSADRTLSIGHYAGFDLTFSLRKINELNFGEAGFHSNISESATGVIQSLEHSVKNDPENAKTQSEGVIKNGEKQVKDIEAELDKPFAQAKEIAELTKKQDNINKQLDLDKNEVCTETMEGEEGDPAEVMEDEANGKEDPENGALTSEKGAIALNLLTPGIDIMRDFKQGLASLLLPTEKSKAHLAAAEVLGHKLGQMNRDAEGAARSIQTESRTFDKLGVHNPDIPLDQNVGVNFMSNMSQGSLMPPEMQLVADKVIRLFEDRLTKLEEAGAPLETVRDTYFPGMWTVQSRRAFNRAIGEAFDQGIGGGIQDLNQWSQTDKDWVKDRTQELMKDMKGSDRDGLQYLTKRPFKGKQSFRKQKVFDDIMTGVDFGLVPISNNPMDLVGLKLAEMDRCIMANRALREYEEKGDVINVNNAGQPLKKALRPTFIKEEWQKINDPYGTIWHRNPDTHLLEKVGYRIAKKPVAEILNNYLSSSLYNSPYFGRVFKSYMASANLLNQSQLSWFSAFHAGFTSSEVTVSSVANVIKDVYGLAIPRNRTISDLTKTVEKVPLAFAQTPFRGAQIIKEWETPSMNIPTDVPVSQLPQNAQGRIAIITKAAELAGGGFKMERGLKTEQTEQMIRNWYGGEKVKAVARSPIALLEASAKPILKWFVPKQKAGVFGELVGRLIEQNPEKTLEQLRPELRQAWNRVDARLGQVRYDRLFMNNVAKNVVQSLIRAPGWTGGTIAEIGGAPRDAGKFFAEWIKTGKAPKDIPDRVAYVAGLLLVTGLANGVLTYVFTGESPQGIDYLAFRDGGKDEQGRATRWLLPTYMKDVYAWYRDPLKTLFAKGHPLISLMYDILMNRDYYNVKSYNEDDNFIMRQIDKGKYIAKQFVPFWIRGAQKSIEREGGIVKTSPLKIIAPEGGIMPAPRAYTQSKLEEYAYGIAETKRPVGARTKEKFEQSQVRQKLEMEMRRGEPEAKADIREARREGKITSKQETEIKKRAKMSATERAVRISNMDVNQMAKAWQIADEEERKELNLLFKKKIDRAFEDKKIDRETKRRYHSMRKGFSILP